MLVARRASRATNPTDWPGPRRRIKDLETELELVKATSALSIGGEVAAKRGSARLFED